MMTNWSRYEKIEYRTKGLSEVRIWYNKNWYIITTTKKLKHKKKYERIQIFKPTQSKN